MQEFINWFIGKLPGMMTLLNFELVSGVTILAFLLALMVVSMLIRSFLHTSREYRMTSFALTVRLSVEISCFRKKMSIPPALP